MTLRATLMLIIFNFLIYGLCVTEDINLMKCLLLVFFFFGPKSCPSPMETFGLGVPTLKLPRHVVV